MGLTPGLERSLGVGNGKPLQYSCLGNFTDRGAWWATVHGSQSWTRLSDRAEHRRAPRRGSWLRETELKC